MKYTKTTPCPDCPFLQGTEHAYTDRRLRQFASGEFPCHKTANLETRQDGTSEFTAKTNSVHCAGALIYMEKRNASHQMMRIRERLGEYDYIKLNMEAPVR